MSDRVTKEAPPRASLLSEAAEAQQAFAAAEILRRAVNEEWRKARDRLTAANDAFEDANARELARAVEGKR